MKIPATVVTGFLGAGKTTLIRSLLEKANGVRIALIINEFGDLGVDRELLAGCGIESCKDDDIIELANGCICCTVADDFLPVMENLINRADPPDHIVIETSGLALPKPLIKAFHWPEVRARVTVDGVIAVVDGPAFASGAFDEDAPPSAQTLKNGHDDNPLEEVFTDQIMAADMVLLNKSDLMDDATRADAERALGARARPGVHILATARGNVDRRVLLGLDAGAEDDLDQRPSHHDDGDHDHDDFDTFALTLGSIGALDRLEAALGDIARDHGVLRIKGFVDVPGKDMRHVVQGVGPRIDRYFDRPWKAGEARQSTLVFIGEKGFDRDAVAAALEAALG